MLEPKKPKGIWISFAAVGVAFVIMGFLTELTGTFIAAAAVALIIAAFLSYGGVKSWKQKNEAFKQYDSMGYLDTLKQSIANGTCVTFGKGKIVANDDTVYYNDEFVSLVKLDMVKNVYKTNIISGQYNYEKKAVALECKDGQVRYMYSVSRSRKNNPDFDAFISYVKNHIVTEGEA